MQRNFKPRLASEAGQGTTEYLLVLFITVAIIITLMWQFSTAFRSYADAFFTDYIGCLLEVGELPGTQNIECQMAAMDLNKGKKNGDLTFGNNGASGGSGGGSGNGSGSNGGSGGSGSGSNSSNANKDSKTNQVGASAAQVGGGSETVGGGSGFGKAGNLSSASGREATTKVGNVKDSKSGDSGLVPIGGGGDYDGGSSSGRGKRTAMDSRYGYFGQEDAEERERDRPPVKQVAKNSDDGSELKPKKTAENMNRKPAAVVAADSGGFSFGELIRMLLIIGIIVAIIVFFGGQMLQISKSGSD